MMYEGSRQVERSCKGRWDKMEAELFTQLLAIHKDGTAVGQCWIAHEGKTMFEEWKEVRVDNEQKAFSIVSYR